MEYRVFKQTVRGMLGIIGELSNEEWEYMGNLWMARMGEEIKDIRKWGEEEMMSYDERLVGVEAMRVMMFLRIMREAKESEGNGISDGRNGINFGYMVDECAGHTKEAYDAVNNVLFGEQKAEGGLLNQIHQMKKNSYTEIRKQSDEAFDKVFKKDKKSLEVSEFLTLLKGGELEEQSVFPIWEAGFVQLKPEGE